MCFSMFLDCKPCKAEAELNSLPSRRYQHKEGTMFCPLYEGPSKYWNHSVPVNERLPLLSRQQLIRGTAAKTCEVCNRAEWSGAYYIERQLWMLAPLRWVFAHWLVISQFNLEALQYPKLRTNKLTPPPYKGDSKMHSHRFSVTVSDSRWTKNAYHFLKVHKNFLNGVGHIYRCTTWLE